MTVKRGGKRREGGRERGREGRRERKKERREGGRDLNFYFFYRVRRGAEQERLEHQKVSVL